MLLQEPSDHLATRKESAARPAFYRMTDVVRITALSRATVYRRIADGKFPPPVHLGGRACGWSPETLQAWIDDPQGYAAPRAQAQCSVGR
ncbi:MAG: AlpA family transcriptional regulator [Variovorax paradoxus]|uniref:AlpA family transcriptional regulator n=1 Tax=Variovorax paradoxus TaxID=34073 RepID=A0A2W5QLC2_VARPD|nr:MAG: AlpA family transcriptional regulator [Variovorax paradoxus]